MVVRLYYRGRPWQDELDIQGIGSCLILSFEVDTLLFKVLTARSYLKLKKICDDEVVLVSKEVEGEY